MIAARPLLRDEIDRVWTIDRREVIDGLYRIEEGRLELVPRRIDVAGWPPGEAEKYTPLLRACFDREGWLLGLFDAGSLVGAAVLDAAPLGRRRDRLQLMFLHVGRAHRGRGLGRWLFEWARAEARRRGARALYVSATPSRHTIDFYRGRGCELAREVDPALFDLEPEDVHLECAIGARAPTRVYVARHGESTWNAERRWAGQADPPLSEAGRAQAKAALETLRGQRFDAVATSTLARARETAAILASGLGVPRLEPSRHFDERVGGRLSGLTSTEIEAQWPGLLARWREGDRIEIPEGEPWRSFVERVLLGLDALATVPGRILLVSHMGVQRAIEDGLGLPRRWYENLEGLWLER